MTTDAGSRTRAIDELRVLVLPAVRAVSRWLPEIVAGLAVLVAVLAGFALGGAALDDRAIAANPAMAQAEVLEGSTFTRTLVRFTVAGGVVVVPEGGVFYPTGLSVGSVVPVEYDLTDPDLVRVAGRTALDGGPVMAIGVLGTWVVLVPLALWLHRRRATDRSR